MRYVKWTLITLITAAAMGCAGDLPDDYFENYGGDGQPVISARDSGPPESTKPPRDSGSTQPDTDTGIDESDDSDASTDSGPTKPAPDSGTVKPDSGPVVTADSGTPDAGPACDFAGLMQAKCAGSTCHGGTTAGSGLDLTSASLGTRVEGREAKGSCPDNLLIDQDNPAESALYLRVKGATCGVKMPLGGSLTPNEQACILSWIEAL